MSLVDDLQKLDQLRSSGSLSEAEFQEAKKTLLSPPPDERRFVSDDQEKRKFVPEILEDDDESLGRAANRYVSFQIFSGIIGFIIFLIVFLTVFLPAFRGAPHFSGGPSQHIEWKKGP